MTHRNPDPWPRDLEARLRRELRSAADPIQAGDDGLARIRAAFRDRPHRRPDLFTWLWLAREWLADHRPVAAPAAGRRLGWLRPAVGIGTALLIVAAGSWAVTSLPQVVAPTANSRTESPIATGSRPAPETTRPQRSTHSAPGGAAAPSASISCPPAKHASPAPSASGSRGGSPSPSSSGSATASGSASPSGTAGGGTPTPTPSAGTAVVAIAGPTPSGPASHRVGSGASPSRTSPSSRGSASATPPCR